MANPLLGNKQVNMMSELQKFRAQLGNADPKEKVMELLRSGKMTPEQFDKLKSQATSIYRMFGI